LLLVQLSPSPIALTSPKLLRLIPLFVSVSNRSRGLSLQMV
jgi:hypothetical protein